jgi:periplasmic protein TonB
MAPIAKDNELLSGTSETAPRLSSNAPVPVDTPVKPQPVALEVPVSVNGARTVEGSDKREPFSEITKTVLIFGSGAVIRLASSVTPGQLLFLTNEKTKKEVVCQVVKSKNYRNVSGYVELEFTEPVVGFWGMRFPGDRLSASSQPVANTLPAAGSPVATVAPPALRPVAPKIDLPAANAAPKIFEQKPAVPPVAARNPEAKLSESKFVAPPAPVVIAPVAPPPAPAAQVPTTASLMPDLAVDAPPVKPTAPVSSTFDLPRNPEAPASIFAEPSQTSTVLPTVDVASLFEAPEPELPSQVPPPLSPASDPETKALKQQTARLQAQLSNMLFMEEPAAKLTQNPPAAPVVVNPQLVNAAARVLKLAKIESAPSAALPAEPARMASPTPRKSMLDEEEMKIPSWLEPLARNAAAPASTQEFIEREKSKRLAEQLSVEEIASEAAGAVNEEPLIVVQAPNFGNELSIDANEPPVEIGSRKSGKGFQIAAIAAGALLLVGAGVWYFRQPSSGVHASPVAVATKPSPALSVPAETLLPQRNAALQTSAPAPTGLPLPASSPSQTNPNANSAGLQPAGVALAPVNNKQIIPNPPKGDSSLEASPSQPVAPQPKKSSLGEVRLATPKVTQRGNTQVGGQSEVGLELSGEQPDSTGTLGAGLAANASQPSAPAPPLPVGGDVRSAKLIASVSPSYPTLARSQHVSGDVRIDALIDATGHVTTMKVVSGPTLLHQAAMDALRQWRYQPASLDGKPVQMHLTVTVQFRMQ